MSPWGGVTHLTGYSLRVKADHMGAAREPGVLLPSQITDHRLLWQGCHSTRCGNSLRTVAIHDLCTHDENMVMGEVGYGGVGTGVVRGDAWVARG